MRKIAKIGKTTIFIKRATISAQLLASLLCGIDTQVYEEKKHGPVTWPTNQGHWSHPNRHQKI